MIFCIKSSPLTNGSAKLRSHGSREHEIDAAASDRTIGGQRADWENCETKKRIRDEEDRRGLEEENTMCEKKIQTWRKPALPTM